MTTPRLDGPRQILRDALTAKCTLSLHPVDDLIAMARKAGVGVKAIARAHCGHRLSTIDHLRLCAAVEVDPMAGFGLARYGFDKAFPTPTDFDFQFFALGLALRQRINRHSDQKACQVIGVRSRTFKRLKAGHVEQIGPVLRACHYVQVHPFGYFTEMSRSIVSRETRVAV